MAWGENNNDNNNSPWGNFSKKGESKQSTFGMGGGSFGGGGNDKMFNFDKFFKNNNGNNGEFLINGKILLGLIIVALIGWGLTGFYTVDATEEGVVLRLGEYHRTAPEGLRYHLPSPIEEVFIVKKTLINSVEVGFRRSSKDSRFGSLNSFGRLNENTSEDFKQPSESLMITGDTNIADVSFVVQWRIKNSFEFLFNITNPIETVKSVSESAMREIIGRSLFAESMTTNRNLIEDDVKNLVQNILDSYNAGIEIYAVNLNDVQNPAPVMPAFLDVETAKQDMQTAINKAKSYENGVVPKARGEARKLIQESEAYKQEVVSIAKGDAARFNSVYNEYVKAKDVTRKRIYIETMQKIYADTNKIILDDSGKSGVVPYLPLNNLNKKSEINQQNNQ
jgi:membrane protease subunit HflK